jgi:hypothetical protein
LCQENRLHFPVTAKINNSRIPTFIQREDMAMFVEALFVTAGLMLAGAISAASFQNAAMLGGWKSAYWFASSVTTAVGLASVLCLLAISAGGPGELSGEMPLTFRLAVSLIYIGVAFSVTGFLATALKCGHNRPPE